MKLAIIGSRGFIDQEGAENIYFKLFEPHTTEIVSGDCSSGADKIGKEIARKFRVKYKGFPAKWDDLSEPCSIGINKFGKKYNKLAGFNRNRDIIIAADMILAFWDGNSAGTKNSLEIAKELKKPTFIVYY